MLIEFVNTQASGLYVEHVYKTKSDSILLNRDAYIIINSIFGSCNKVKVEYQYATLPDGIRYGEPFFRNIRDVEAAIEKEIFYDTHRIA